MKRGTQDFALKEKGWRGKNLDRGRENADNGSVMKGVVRMRRFLCGFLCLCLLWTGLCFGAAAEDAEAELTEEELEEIRKLDEEVTEERVTGRVYEEPTLKDFDMNSPAIYTCTIRDGNPRIFSEKDKKSKVLMQRNGGITNVEILYAGLRWVIVRKDNIIGYVLREWTAGKTHNGKPTAVDPSTTPVFGTQKHAYIAETATYCHVRKSMSFNEGEGDDGNNWVILNPGTKISIWQFYDGWAMVNYMREYGYIDPNELTNLKPVSPTDEELYEDCPIAAYTSYYKMDQNETNIGRIHNIALGAEFISIVLQPGDIFDGNKILGPYTTGHGYKAAPVLINGKAVPGAGGGTCQVASTLYNVVLQLPGLEVLYRHAHGGSGASYLPIHVDAAVGRDDLNLRFKNQYDFPIRIEASSQSDGALTIRMYKVH